MFKQKPKIFCIGTGKTGTTSLGVTLEKLGFTLGDQEKGELLLDAWYERDFNAIIKYCKSSNAFQDIPFSLPYTYTVLDQHFDNAKFILTERDNADQWYRSLTKFHTKLWSKGNAAPNRSELESAAYRYPGFAYKAQKYIYNTPDDDLYNEEQLKNYYLHHNSQVKEYFRGKEDKLIVLNVSRKEDFNRLCSFLGVTSNLSDFPWENKT